MNQTPAIPDISVITVVRNGMDTIAATLGSVEEQSHSGIEHLIIDGASSDGTLDLLAKRAHSRLRVYSASDRGIYDAMNTGAHLARGAWLVFINADDRLAGPNALAGAFFAAESDPTAIHIFDYMAEANGLAPIQRSPRWQPDAGMSVCHQAVLYPRSVFDRVGYYDLSYRIAADYDHLLRCHLAGVRIRNHPHVLSTFALEGTSSRNMHLAYREAATIARTHLGPHASMKIHALHGLAASRKAISWATHRLGGKELQRRLRGWWLTHSNCC